MAIKVNNTATNKDGLVIPSGYLIGFNMMIPDNTKELHYSPKVYASEEFRSEGKSQVHPTFIGELAFVYKPTDEEFASINPLSVNQFYQAHVEAIEEIGEGNTEIVL